MTDPVQVPIPDVVTKTTKAMAATVTTGLGVLTLLSTSISDGVLTWGEGGLLIGAVSAAATTVLAVWRVPNEVKRPQ